MPEPVPIEWVAEPPGIEPADPAPTEPVDGPPPIDPVEPAPIEPVPEPPIMEPGVTEPLGDDSEPPPAPGMLLVPMPPPIDVPLDVPEPTEALGFMACASRLQTSKSDCVGSAARAGLTAATIPATANSAVARYSFFISVSPPKLVQPSGLLARRFKVNATDV
jgi:hypothetical protein